MKLIFTLVISISYYICLLPCFGLESSPSIVDVWKLESGDVLHAFDTVSDIPFAKSEIYSKYTIIEFRSDGNIVLEHSSKMSELIKPETLESMAVAKKLHHPNQIGDLVYFDTDRTGTVEGYFLDNSVLIKQINKAHRARIQAREKNSGLLRFRKYKIPTRKISYFK